MGVKIRATISGKTYNQDRIVSCRANGGLFSGKTLSVGGCVSAQLEIELLNPDEIPRGSSVKVEALPDPAGQWVPQGIFFIDTRTINKELNTITLSCYDAMLKAEQAWLTPEYESKNWPMPQKDAVNDIASRMEIEVDPRTSLTTKFPVEYPVGEYGDLTMREVLSFIAMSNAGNWIITNEGKLLLVKFLDMPPETNYLVDHTGAAILFGEVRILV